MPALRKAAVKRLQTDKLLAAGGRPAPTVAQTRHPLDVLQVEASLLEK
jgi:hypothetical protein